MSQTNLNDCGENQNSPQKLFVFVGEFLEAKTVPARRNYNEARFVAKYRIVQKICGDYQGDTIVFDVIKLDYDSSFMRSKFLLLMLTKDAGEDEQFVLWANLYHDLFKTAKGLWASPYSGQDEIQYVSAESYLKPKRIKFSKEAFYDTKGMTREEIDITFPEPFFKIKKNKAIPLIGNSITELFQFRKDGILKVQNIYGQTDTVTVEPDSNLKRMFIEISAPFPLSS